MKKLLFFLFMFCFVNVVFSQCPQPTNLNITNYTTNSLTLSWTPGDLTQSSWEIQYSLSDSNFSNYTSLFVNSTIFGLTGLYEDGIYYFRVRAICGNYMSDYSNYVFIPTVACAPPYNEIISDITSTSAILNFAPVDSNFRHWELGFKVEGGNTSWNYSIIDTNYVEFENLLPNTTYLYSLRTQCGDQLSNHFLINRFTTSPVNLNILNNNKTFYICGDYIFDDGGEIGDHGNNYSYSVTLCPTDNQNNKKRIAIEFKEFSLGSGDKMSAYSKNTPISIDSVIEFQNNFLNNKTIYSNLNDSTGCVTLNLTTNPTGSSTGFKAYVYCVERCQIPIADLETFYVKIDANGNYNQYPFESIIDSIQTTPIHYRLINYCEGDSVILYPKPRFPENNISYSQNTNNCYYRWSMGDGTNKISYFNNSKVSHKWQDVGLYNINLTVTDTNYRYINGVGCKSSNPINTIVRVSKNPINSIAFLPEICSGTPFLLSAGYNSDNLLVLDTIGIKYSPIFGKDSLTFIPDGMPNNLCAELPVMISGYQPYDIISSKYDIASACINIEHSYLADINIDLICPNGQKTTLKAFSGGYGFFLGLPYGGNSHGNYDSGSISSPQNIPGRGWNYCFSQKKSNAYSELLKDCNNVSVTDPSAFAENCQVCDSTNINNPLSYYIPEQDFSNLIGCPKNGEWKIQICDNWSMDNGFLFSWDLELDSSSLDSYLYQVNIDTVIWNSPFTTAINSTTSIFNPPFNETGYFETNVRIVDEYGCVYDTNTLLNVIQSPSTPTDLNLNIETNSIRLSWQGDALSYEVYRDNVLVAEVYQPVYIDPNVDITSNYCYKIMAKGSVCNSEFSNTKCSLIGLEDEITSEFTANLYPNPTNNKTMLEVHGLNKNSEVFVSDLQGRLLKKYNLNIGQGKLEINVESLAKGIYYIKIVNEDSSLTKKLIVE